MHTFVLQRLCPVTMLPLSEPPSRITSFCFSSPASNAPSKNTYEQTRCLTPDSGIHLFIDAFLLLPTSLYLTSRADQCVEQADNLAITILLHLMTTSKKLQTKFPFTTHGQDKLSKGTLNSNETSKAYVLNSLRRRAEN